MRVLLAKQVLYQLSYRPSETAGLPGQTLEPSVESGQVLFEQVKS